MTLDELNHLPVEQSFGYLQQCCGSEVWVNNMLKQRPYKNRDDLLTKAETNWLQLSHDDWLEAFAQHPKIGEQKSFRWQEPLAQSWSAKEQAGIASAHDLVKQQLNQLNIEYEQKFGFIYIVCATGKSAEEMLAILKQRISHDRDQEILIAAKEQSKITRIRLEKLLL